MTFINQEMINKANTKCDAYEAPHLTIIPLRTSGAMLVGSMMKYEELDLRSSFQASSDYDDGFSTDEMTTDGVTGWGSSFFD